MIQITLGSVSFEVVPVITDAPVGYDGFGTFTLVDFGCPVHVAGAETRKDARLVLVRKEHTDWQCCRYSSGLYSAVAGEKVDEHLRDERTITEALYKRLVGLEK